MSFSNALLHASSVELQRFNRGISVLDTIVTLAPLLGLFGTVTGMIHAFGLLGASELGAPTAITGGIAETLHATVLFGLRRVTPPRPLPVAAESLEVELTTAPEEPDPPKPKPPALLQKPKTSPSVSKPVSPTSAGPSNGTSPAAVKKAGPTTGVRVRSNPAPAYPAAARSANQEGVVTLDVQVSATGTPTTVTLASSSGFPAFDQAAIAAVRRWRFEPAKAAGTPSAGRVRVPIRFRLDR